MIVPLYMWTLPTMMTNFGTRSTRHPESMLKPLTIQQLPRIKSGLKLTLARPPADGSSGYAERDDYFQMTFYNGTNSVVTVDDQQFWNNDIVIVRDKDGGQLLPTEFGRECLNGLGKGSNHWFAYLVFPGESKSLYAQIKVKDMYESVPAGSTIQVEYVSIPTRMANIVSNKLELRATGLP